MRTAIALRHVHFEDLGLIDPVLVHHGYRVRYLTPGIDPVEIQQLVDADLVIVLGGPIGVYQTEAYPFLVEELAAITARVQVRRPTLGICLGAQLIARALGAEVAPTGGHEIGFAPLQLTAEAADSPLRHAAGVPVLHWHGDAFQIPAGAVRLAGTPGFPNQAFALGSAILALQFHLEVDHRMIERWLVGHAAELSGKGIDPAAIRADAARFGPGLAGIARTIFTEWIGALS